MLNLLRSYWKADATYIEPFAGSACLFFDIEPQHAVLGDLNSELIASYRVLRDDVESVISQLKHLEPTRDNYYRVRARSPNEMSSSEAAARFFFLNRYCFNGLYRTNLKGDFNVPFGDSKGGSVMDELLLTKASQMLNRVQLVNADFEVTIDRARSGDFVYLDPPYVSRSQKVFSEYLPNSFTEGDLTRLGECLDELDRRGITFVITYSDCEESQELLGKWAPHRWKARRHIAGFAAHRRFSYELIATNRVN